MRISWGITEGGAFERHGKPVEEKEFMGLTEALERVVKELRLEKQTVAEADEDMPENAASETDGTETKGRSFLTRQQR